MRVLVCGSRNFNNRQLVERALSNLHAHRAISLLIEGGSMGADHLAQLWAIKAQVPVRTFRAEWALEGKKAGPLRNQRMLVEGKPELVLAFEGGRGTDDMVLRAVKADVRVVRVTDGSLNELL